MNVKVYLVPFDSGMAQVVRQWRNDWRVWRWCRQSDLISDAEQADWFQRQHKDPTIKMYGIAASDEEKPPEEGKLVGVAGFTSIDHFNKRAEFSLYVNPKRHGMTLGQNALRVLLGHGFGNLGFNVIYGETFDGNPAAKLFEKIGLVKEGTRRQFYWKDGNYVDAHLYSLTRNEWCTIAASRPC